MIYGEKSSGLSQLAKLAVDQGMIYTNEEIMVKYLDMDEPRDDSLLDQVKMTSTYGKKIMNRDKFNKAVKTEILKPHNDELKSRFVCFIWAAFGASTMTLIQTMTSEYAPEEYERVMYEGLLPWLGGEKAKKCALAVAFVFEEIGMGFSNETRYIMKGRTAAEIAEIADIILPTNDFAATIIYAKALEKADEKADAELIKRICTYLYDNPKDKGTRHENDDYLLACGEGSFYFPQLKSRFIEDTKAYTHRIADLAIRKGCLKVIDAIAGIPERCDRLFINELADYPNNEYIMNVLERIAKEHTGIFTIVLKSNSDVEKVKLMCDILKKNGLPVPDTESILKAEALTILSNTHRNDCTRLEKYVNGELSAEDVIDEMVDAPYGNSMYETFDIYSAMGLTDFFCRYFAAMMTINGGYSLSWMIERATGLDFGDKTKDGINALCKSGLPVWAVINAAASYIENMYSSNKDRIIQNAAAGLAEYASDLKGIDTKKLSATGRQIAVTAWGIKADEYKEELMAAADDSSKAVKFELAKIFGAKPEWKEDIVRLLGDKKAARREIAVAAIERQGSADYKAELEAAFEKEKGAKIKDKIALLIGAASAGDSSAAPASAIDMIEELTKGGKAKKVAFAFDGSIKPVHDTDGNEVEQKYLEALLLCYANMSEPGVSKTAETLAKKLNVRELNAFAEVVFAKWLDQGAQAKTKWVLYFAAIHGGEKMVEEFMHYIKYWGENSRGAIASDAVRAMALGGSTTALMNVDGMSRKFKNKMVRNAAANALANAAKELGLTTEELADKIVPDLGFDENMCREFDFGPRQFKVYLAAGNNIEIFCGEKQVKNLPKPAASDDAEKAAAAAADFKEMKKQLKTVATNQKARLENVLMNDRKWTVEGWKALFVKNAVMHGFAMGLIWGLYEDGDLKDTFRYTEEGSFNTADDDELELPENGSIGLVHPLELTAEQISAWKEQLEDYEIAQPFPQLDRKVYTMTDKEREGDKILRFDGIELNSLSLIGKMTKSGWYKGQAEDAGWFHYFWREDISSRNELPDGTVKVDGVFANLDFTGASIVNYDFEGEEVTVEGLSLFKPGANLYRDKPMKIGEVSARYFSELIMQLTAILGDNNNS